MMKESYSMKGAFIAACIGIALTLLAAILFLCGKSDWSTALSIASTGVSIVLGFFSIAYTYKSGQKTLDNLEKIQKQYSALVERIHLELADKNRNDVNIDDIRRELEAELRE